MSSSVYIDNKGKDILILGKGPTQRLDRTTFIAEGKYPINFMQSERFVLNLHYNGNNSFLFVNATEVYQCKAKHSEIKYYALCLDNISENFTSNNLKKIELKGVVKSFSVDYNPINTNNILNIHKYSMKRRWYKIMFGIT